MHFKNRTYWILVPSHSSYCSSSLTRLQCFRLCFISLLRFASSFWPVSPSLSSSFVHIPVPLCIFICVSSIPSRMATHLKSLLSEARVAAFHHHFLIPDDIHLSLVTDNVVDMERVDANTIIFSLLSIARVRFVSPYTFSLGLVCATGVSFPLNPMWILPYNHGFSGTELSTRAQPGNFSDSALLCPSEINWSSRPLFS